MLSSLLIFVALSGATARADELVQLPAGTKLHVPPDFDEKTLSEPMWLLTRPQVEMIIVKDADLEACRQAIKACEARTITAPPSSFWATTTGKVLVGVAGAALFGGGVYIGSKF